MALAIVLIVLFGLWQGSIEFLRPLLEPPLLYVIVSVLLYSVLIRPYLASRSLIKSSSGSSGTSDYVFSDSGVDIRREHFEAHYDWAAIQRAKQSAHLLILYTNSYSAIILPKRCFANAEQLANLRTLLTNHVKRRSAFSATPDSEKQKRPTFPPAFFVPLPHYSITSLLLFFLNQQ